MNDIGKIVGFPLKLFNHNMIYLPMEYLRYYGISVQKDKLLLVKFDRSLLYKPLPSVSTLYSQKDVVSIRIGLTTIPAAWIRQNKLKKGDTLFLLGLADGLIVYMK